MSTLSKLFRRRSVRVAMLGFALGMLIVGYQDSTAPGWPTSSEYLVAQRERIDARPMGNVSYIGLTEEDKYPSRKEKCDSAYYRVVLGAACLYRSR